jgi:hypothetical protein
VIALLVGAALAVGALAYVLYPLFAVGPITRRRAMGASRAATEGAIDALREIEFDRATGKLSDDDYAALKAEYTRSALVELRSREDAPAAAESAALDDAIAAADPAEAAVLRYRSVRRACETCGPRPEPDPAFCSSCGKYLRGTCSHCGATVTAPASRFCANCGSSLAA